MVNVNKLIKSRTTKRETSKFTRPSGAGNFDNMDDKNIVDQINIKKGTVDLTPTNPKDIANKAYVDAGSGGAPEGTAVLSTGEAGGTKFLREDGDGTSSWQDVAAGTGLWEVDVNNVKLTTARNVDIQDKFIDFTGIIDPTYSAGRLWYSSDTDTLSFYNAESDVTLQIGQELWVAVRNVSETTISDFTPVYQTGTTGHRPHIALGKADNATTARLIGITTHAIENNTNGLLTVEGVINNVDTDGSPFSETWLDGDIIYLSPTTAGAMTNIKPTGADEFVIELGRVLDATNNGSFLVKGIQSTNVLDEDNFATNSSTQPPSQQSAKAYVDNATTDVAANTAASHAESHTILSHNDTTATGTELNTLTGGGDTTLHDHDGISENTSARHTQNTDTALGSGAEAADHGTAATDQIVNIAYGTGSPPTANTTTIGSLFVKYTA